MRTEAEKVQEEQPVVSGGPPCSESQADGVPCDEIGRDCEDCEKAKAAEAEPEREG